MKEVGFCHCSADAEHGQESKDCTWNRQDSAWGGHPQPCREPTLGKLQTQPAFSSQGIQQQLLSQEQAFCLDLSGKNTLTSDNF